MDFSQMNIAAGWIGILLGIISGAVIGLFFHRDNFAGGYDSWTRRMMRLGHISFFGIGFINLAYGLTWEVVLNPSNTQGLGPVMVHMAAGVGLMIALVAMPACCFGAAAYKPIRHLFFIPVTLTLLGVAWIPFCQFVY